MAKVKCPKCGTEIELSKSDYNNLLNDIAGEEVDKRVKEQVEALKAKYDAELALAKNKAGQDSEKELLELKSKLQVLEEKLKNSDSKTQLAVSEANKISNEKLVEKEKELAELRSKYDFDIKAKEEEVQRWKEFRVGDSTKDIGESLEQFCHDSFDEIRAIAYPNAYFEKDNEVVGGTKGDFIFKDYSDEDKEHEMVSIMFEMKNQKEDGDTKNESHLKKLDGDRNKKKCEYAVLVSTLEPESKLYNSGIVDVSHKYPKMFVVRPQFFLTIIGLIKNMAKTRFEYKKQVIQYQRENIDITNFENAVRVVAQKINDDYDNAGKQYDKVEKMCDDMIKRLTELKETFRLGQKWIGAAQNQLPELEIRKLTKNNPTMKEKFEELNEDK